MADYGHDLKFGYFLDPSSNDPAGSLKLAQSLDQLGYDFIGIQDHPYHQGHLDAMTLISFILGQTEHIRAFPDVANLPLRPPLMLAKQAATIDQLSGGRFELGLGAGAFWEGVRAMGGPVRKPKDALGSLGEAVGLIRDYWSGASLRHKGEYYTAAGTRPGPQPAHDIGIWLGVTGPRALRLTGEIADGWVPSMAYVPPERAAKSSLIIDEAAHAAGRDPAAIRRVYNLGGEIQATSAEAEGQIVGPPSHWVGQLTSLALDIGFSTFILWGAADDWRLKTFIQDIAPAVRERVVQARAGRA